MSLLQICEWLRDTPLSTSLRESTWDYAVVGLLHLIGIAVFGGTMVMGNLRLLGLWMPGQRVSEVLTPFRRWKWAGFLIITITGGLLTLSEPVLCYKSRSFRWSIVLLLLAGINGAWFRFGVYRSVSFWDEAQTTPRSARMAAGLSLLLWAALVIAGRGIAYF